MKRHAFGWGTAVDARLLLGQGPDYERYREIITENFNKAVLENDMKWPFLPWSQKSAHNAVSWLRERGLAVRGHVLLWPGKENLPEPSSMRCSIDAGIQYALGQRAASAFLASKQANSKVLVASRSASALA
jgi:hypothetical protein